MGKKTPPCCKLYANLKHTLKSSSVREITDEDNNRIKILFPWFEHSRSPYLCVSCRCKLNKDYNHLLVVKRGLELAKKIKANSPADAPSAPPLLKEPSLPGTSIVAACTAARVAPEANVLPIPTPSGSVLTSSSINTAAINSPGVGVPDFALADLNRTLELVNITPVRPCDSEKPSRLRQKYFGLRNKVKAQIKLFSKNGVDPSPQPTRKHNCIYCRCLLKELSAKYASQETKAEKYKVLTCIPKCFSIQEVQKSTNCTAYEARHANLMKGRNGAFWFPLAKLGRPMAQEDVQTVVTFYVSDNNSRPSPNLRDVVYVTQTDGEKVRKEKRRILHNLNDLYTTFRQHFPNITVSISKFASLRPKNCVWPGRLPQHVVCVCEIHQNFEFLLQALGINMTVRDFVKTVVCENPNDECFLGVCGNCPNFILVNDFYGNMDDDDDVTYTQWTHTDSTEITQITTSILNFKVMFNDKARKIIVHDFVHKIQSDHIEHLKTSTLKAEAAVTIQVDFAQNYTFVVQNAVQGFHWTNRQATVHPFVIHWWDLDTDCLRYKTYCIISDEMNHDANTFHVFRTEVLKKIKKDFDDIGISKCYYISDGAGGQYKNYKNFANLMMHKQDFNLEAEWIFSATSHGKGTCDAISAVVKCSTRRESLKNNVLITTPLAMFDFCVAKFKGSDTLSFIYVSSDEVSSSRDRLNERYKMFKKLNGTRNHHIFRPISENVIRMVKAGNSIFFTDIDFVEKEFTFFTEDNVTLGNFYAFFEANTYHVGLLVETDSSEGDVKLQTLQMNRTTGICSWPESSIYVDVSYRDIIFNVEDPICVDDERFQIPKEQLKAIKSQYSEFKKRGRVTLHPA